MNKQLFRIWHRRIGVFSLLMILWLALSGSLINHSDSFGFNKKNINFLWLNQLYGLDKTIEEPQAILILDSYFFCYEGSLYRDSEILANCTGTILAGAIDENEKLFFLLNEFELLVLDNNFELFDSIPLSLLNNSISDIFIINEQLVLRSIGSSEKEERLWLLNIESLTLEPYESDQLVLDGEQLVLIDLSEKLKAQLLYTGVTIERFLLDAHSGRLFGAAGVFVVDLFAFAFVLIALSGLWLFLKKNLH